MILINKTEKKTRNINVKTQRFGFPDYQSKCKTNCLHLVAGEAESALGASLLTGGAT